MRAGAAYVARRTAHALLVVWATFTLTFFLLFILPGNAALNRIAGGGAGSAALTLANVNALKKSLGIDKPMLVQYIDALWHAVHGNFGLSFETGGSATALFFQAVPSTLELAGAALVLAIVVGMAWGIVASDARFEWLRELFASLPALGISLPTFFVGLVLLQIFSYRLNWFPSVGGTGVKGLILPAVMLAIPTSAMIAQLLIRSLSETLASPYIETAVAKGLTRRAVLLGHALRNAILPVVTQLGVTAGYLLAGSVVAEQVFSRQGIGTITINAVSNKDTPVVLLAVVFVAAVFATINLIVDLLYPTIDRRISIEAPGGTPAVAR